MMSLETKLSYGRYPDAVEEDILSALLEPEIEPEIEPKIEPKIEPVIKPEIDWWSNQPLRDICRLVPEDYEYSEQEIDIIVTRLLESFHGASANHDPKYQNQYAELYAKLISFSKGHLATLELRRAFLRSKTSKASRITPSKGERTDFRSPDDLKSKIKAHFGNFSTNSSFCYAFTLYCVMNFWDIERDFANRQLYATADNVKTRYVPVLHEFELPLPTDWSDLKDFTNLVIHLIHTLTAKANKAAICLCAIKLFLGRDFVFSTNNFGSYQSATVSMYEKIVEYEGKLEVSAVFPLGTPRSSMVAKAANSRAAAVTLLSTKTPFRASRNHTAGALTINTAPRMMLMDGPATCSTGSSVASSQQQRPVFDFNNWNGKAEGNNADGIEYSPQFTAEAQRRYSLPSTDSFELMAATVTNSSFDDGDYDSHMVPSGDEEAVGLFAEDTSTRMSVCCDGVPSNTLTVPSRPERMRVTNGNVTLFAAVTSGARRLEDPSSRHFTEEFLGLSKDEQLKVLKEEVKNRENNLQTTITQASGCSSDNCMAAPLLHCLSGKENDFPDNFNPPTSAGKKRSVLETVPVNTADSAHASFANIRRRIER